MAEYTYPKAKDFYNFTPKQQAAIKFRGKFLLPKRDGCCVKVQYTEAGLVFLSSDDKPVYSLEHLRMMLSPLFIPGDKLICEAFIPGRSLQYVSGKLRQHDPCPELRLMVWDAKLLLGSAKDTFRTRMEIVEKQVEFLRCSAFTLAPARIVGVSPAQVGLAEDELRQECFAEALDAVRTGIWHGGEATLAGPFDGAILRDPDEPYTEGRSAGGIIKIKPTLTYDLEVVDVLLGTGVKTGKRTASLLLRWSEGRQQKAGSGLTQADVDAMHEDKSKFIGRIAEIEAKAAKSDDGMLLEPAFQRWRQDRTTGEF